MNPIYPGSFDPVTSGHVNIARRAAAIFGGLTVAVLDNPYKNPLFSVNERVYLLREVFSRDANIQVEAFSGLLAEYVKKKSPAVIIRGIRGPEDLSKEQPYAVWNSQLSGGVETMYLTAEPALAHISGSIVKEVAAHIYREGLDDKILAQMVPPAILAPLQEKFI